MKLSPISNNSNEENSLKSEEKISSEEDIIKKPEDNTRYGDWVKNGRTIDF